MNAPFGWEAPDYTVLANLIRATEWPPNWAIAATIFGEAAGRTLAAYSSTAAGLQGAGTFAAAKIPIIFPSDTALEFFHFIFGQYAAQSLVIRSHIAMTVFGVSKLTKIFIAPASCRYNADYYAYSFLWVFGIPHGWFNSPLFCALALHSGEAFSKAALKPYKCAQCKQLWKACFNQRLFLFNERKTSVD